MQSETVLTNIRVLAIDQAPKEKDGQNSVVGKTVTLELKPEQAETLARVRQSGTLSLALRSIADVNIVESNTDESQRRSDSVNVVRYGVHLRDDDTEVIRRTYRYEIRGNRPTLRALTARALSFSAVAGADAQSRCRRC